MKLREIAEGLWEAEGQVSPGPGMRMATRMTVVRLPTGGLVVHSPIELDDSLAAAVDALGSVRHLVAPNLFHHLFVSGARERWPEASLAGPPGLSTKRDDLRVDDVLEKRTAWLDCFDVFPIDGMPKFQERVLFHRPTETLLVADLLFHRPTGHNAATRFFFLLAGTRSELAVSRLFKSMIKDKAAFKSSLQPLLELPAKRVVMAHGRVLEGAELKRFEPVLRSVM